MLWLAKTETVSRETQPKQSAQEAGGEFFKLKVTSFPCGMVANSDKSPTLIYYSADYWDALRMPTGREPGQLGFKLRQRVSRT